MGLFSFSRKNQQQSSTGNSDFYSQADEETPASRKRGQGKKREEAIDPLLPQKKRARRRLIGAVALVLAAVIGLPMILDTDPKPLSSDIAIQIPSRDAPSHAQTQTPPAAASADATNTISPDSQAVAPSGSDAPEPAAQPAQKTPSATAADTPAPAAKTAAPEPAVAENAAAEHAAAEKKADDAARARAILEGKSPQTTAAKSSGKVVLQVAALTTQEKVDELQKKLTDAGLKSYTEKVKTSSGVWIRVRIGPFANDAEAEKVRARLVKLGLNGKLLPA